MTAPASRTGPTSGDRSRTHRSFPSPVAGCRFGDVGARFIRDTPFEHIESDGGLSLSIAQPRKKGGVYRRGACDDSNSEAVVGSGRCNTGRPDDSRQHRPERSRNGRGRCGKSSRNDRCRHRCRRAGRRCRCTDRYQGDGAPSVETGAQEDYKAPGQSGCTCTDGGNEAGRIEACCTQACGAQACQCQDGCEAGGEEGGRKACCQEDDRQTHPAPSLRLDRPPPRSGRPGRYRR